MRRVVRARAGKRNREEPGAGPGPHPPYPWAAAALAVLLVLGAYSNAFRGEFVYDDNLEIEANPYIQRPELFWTAMTSDVWAFKGRRDQPWSNYWRPAFVAWMAVNYQLFGLNVVGWHATSIAAHVVATLLVLAVVLRLGARPAVAAVVAWLFAVHPVHVESVAWASGIPDIIMSACLLASYLFYLSARQRGGWARWFGAVGLYALALLCKEGAIVYPFIVLATEWLLGRREGSAGGPSAPTALRRAAVFLAVAVVFVAARFHVLGTMRQLAPGAPDLTGVLVSAPAILVFYLKQIVWPATLGPVYGVRALTPAGVGLYNFALPLLILGALAALVWRLARHRTTLALGAVWFLFPIALALDIRVFVPEQIVHDRYLYLPLMGALLVAVELIAMALEWIAPASPARAGTLLTAAGSALAVTAAVLTWRYNPVWGENIALWERGIRVDPASSSTFAELGNAYWQVGRRAEAKRALARAMELNPDLTNAHVGLAVIANGEGRHADAEQYLKPVVDRFPEHDTAREQLALAHQQQGRIDQAIAIFDEGRKRMPFKRGVYSQNIAVLLAMSNRTEAALAELESIRDEARREPALVEVWCQIGDLHRLHGRGEQAAEAYRQFLSLTAGSRDPAVQSRRASVTRILGR